MERPKVNLGGIIHFSTIDWRGKAAMVIFLRRCPLRCIYCQNYNLLEDDDYKDMDVIEDAIRASEDFIDAVVLSGGEPFMQPQVIDAIAKYARGRGLMVGVQTNGYYPERVESLHAEIDRIFLDIKMPLNGDLYERLTKVRDASERVRKTLEVCLHANIELELVTTVFRDLVGAAEVKEIVKELCDLGAADCPYIIQQGRIERIPPHAGLTESSVFSYDELKELAQAAYRAAAVKEVRIRTRETGEEVVVRATSAGVANDK